MPKANPLPRKFLMQLEDAQAELRQIATQSKNLLHDLDSPRIALPNAKSVLHEIEATAYKIALDLSQIDIADTCDTCPAAPATTKYQAHLLVLASTLEQQADMARRCVETSRAVDELASLNTDS